ncbi:metallophosphoesterase family protein [Rhodohalobacter sp. 8-1]|uniref:metallophosphoesterase family protein n=1 Tax=Rhodohalobacter sp. 8-1 TaxID=3131972 RepID=UPI0030EEF116
MKVLLFCLLTIHLFQANLIAQLDTNKPDLRIVLMSDLNESYGSTHYGRFVDSTMAYVEKWQPDLVLFAGDMIAGQSLKLSETEIRAMWSGFDETIGGPLRDLNIPFAFTLGNHDGSKSGNFDHERELAKEYWSTRMPDLTYINNENFPFYYSFSFDDLFVISWDASGHLISKEEINWIKEQLTQEEAKNAALRLIIGHLPLYAIAEGRNRPGEVLNDADQLFEMMTDYGVDYYFSGHHHAWYPAVKDGLKMIHSGAQGSGPRALIGSKRPPRRTITLLEQNDGSGDFSISTYDMHDNMKVITPDQLPLAIEGINGRIERYNYDD